MRLRRVVLAVVILSGASVLVEAAAPTSGTPAPLLRITPTSLDFGPVQMGTTPPNQDVTITNVGPSPWIASFTGGAASGPFNAASDCGGKTLASGQSCHLIYSILTTTVGPASGQSQPTLSGYGTATVDLSGTVLAPRLQITPTSLDFGPVQMGTTPPNQDVTITNVGPSPWIASFTGGAASGPFNAASDCGGKTLASGQSCHLIYSILTTTVGPASGQSQPTLSGYGTATVDLSGTVLAPRLQITPTSLDFGPVPVGVSPPSQVATVTNVGSSPYTVSILGGAASGGFNAAQSCEGVTLAPGQSCTLVYDLVSETIGTHTGLSQPDFVGVGTFDINLAADRITGPLVVSPTSIDFGPVVEGNTTSPDTATITNVGLAPYAGPITIGSPTSSDFGTGTDCSSKLPLAPGASCTVSISFSAPANPGTVSGSVTITPQDAGTFTIELAGTSVAPLLRVTPTQVVFVPTPVGLTAPTEDVTVTNVDLYPATLQTVGGAPGDPQFSYSDGCNGVTLQPGDSCVFAYSFTPAAGGVSSTGATIGIEGVGGYPITLTGDGIPPGSDTPVLAALPTGLDFGPVVPGTTSPQQQVVIYNTGPVPVPAVTGGGGSADGVFQESTTCGSAIPAQGSCIYSYSFTPTVAGPDTFTTTITGGPSGTTFTITLAGTGIGPRVRVSPTALAFPPEALGVSAPSQAVTIENVGPAPFAATYGGGGVGGDFSGFQNCVSSTLLTGQGCQFTYDFTPSAGGPESTTTTIGISGLPNVTVSLTGGVAPEYEISPTGLAFGPMTVGDTSALQPVTLTDAGPGPLTITGIGGGGFNTFNGFTGFTGNCPNTLSQGQSCTLANYQFVPQAVGTVTNSTSIGVSFVGGSATAAINVSGEGDAPDVMISPTGLAFGPMTVGDTSALQPVTLTNVGTSPLTITGIGGGGFNTFNGFTGFTGNCPNTLSQGQSCTLANYQFVPQAAGTVTNSTGIGLTFNGIYNQFVAVNVDGEGDAPDVMISPTGLSFGPVTLGQTPPLQAVTMTNVGTSPLTITGIGGGGFNTFNGFTGFTGNCPKTLSQGQSCTLANYQFVPQAAGTVTNSTGIGLTFNGIYNQFVTVNVDGTGISVLPTLTIASLGIYITGPLTSGSFSTFGPAGQPSALVGRGTFGSAAVGLAVFGVPSANSYFGALSVRDPTTGTRVDALVTNGKVSSPAPGFEMLSGNGLASGRTFTFQLTVPTSQAG